MSGDATRPGRSSAIYEGRVRHRRMEPLEHEFEYPLFMAYLDLDQLPGVFDGITGWSARRSAPARFRRSDYLGGAERPLADCVRERVVELGGSEPRGPIRLLTNLRYFGHCFNPVSFYFCWDESDMNVEQVLAEVTNTPWGERHAYLIGREAESTTEPGRGRVIRGNIEKAFHVSPLMGMDHSYDWRTTQPGRDLIVHIDSRRNGRVAFDATLTMERRELSPATARRVLARYPVLSIQVLARIYWQSLRLKLKGARYFPHPGRARTGKAG